MKGRLRQQTRQGSKKLEASSCAAGIDEDARLSNRLFIKDAGSGTDFLVDTGAEVSILPARSVDKLSPKTRKLYTANGSTISTYGERTLYLDIGLRRPLRWIFILADVPHGIIGADLLSHYHLSVSVADDSLTDDFTGIKCKGTRSTAQVHEIYTLSKSGNIPHILNPLPVQSLQESTCELSGERMDVCVRFVSIACV